jgi:polyphenol oxidase
MTVAASRSYSPKTMLIHPDLLAPANILVAMTTREGGVSRASYDSLNLGYATQDKREHVAENERRVAAAMQIDAAAIRWVYQVHGHVVRRAEDLPANDPLGATTIEGDAIVSRTRGLVCGVKIADCMPVLFASDDGDVVGAVHAGWRGLSSGVLENTVAAMQTDPARILAWLGPCIGAQKFEVGRDVREAFLANAPAESLAVVERAFAPLAIEGKYLCDLRAIARERLRAAGVAQVYASEACTMSEPKRFFSHRRDKVTGRMAAFIGIK